MSHESTSLKNLAATA